MKNRIILAIIGSVFIISMVLILTNNLTTVYCTKCEEEWLVGSIPDEEKNYYVCPDCKRTDCKKTDCKKTDESDTDDSGSIYTDPVKGMLHRQMGGTGGLW